MDCPKCKIGKLSPTTVRGFKPGPDIELTVDQCFTCHGVWFDAGELEKYLKEGLSAVSSAVLPDASVQELSQRVGLCPRCNLPMIKRDAPAKKKIEVDYCTQCRGFWLDCTEVDRLEPNRSLADAVGNFFDYLAYLSGRRQD